MKRFFVPIFILFISFNLNGQDHSEFIVDPLESPQEVTQTCLTCHDNAAQEVMATNHWTWLDEEFVNAEGETVARGKQNFINNFCIAVPSNYARCTSCHVGYGWKDDSFDFSNEENVDCLVCHDQSGQYTKVPTGAGIPAENVDLLASAQSVGLPTRKNCGICHFDGGGGAGVKHGDLDDSLYDPAPETDVHMGKLGFECIDCHKSDGHKIMGAGHGSMASNQNHFDCTDCHEGEVHSKKSLNKHLNAVACETCHVPTFARVEPTKVWWDWSKAGENIEVTYDENGKDLFNKKKGEFKWAKDVIPTYKWFNGGADYYAFGDKLDSEKIVKLNELSGSINDAEAKIAPFKVMRGKQIYDSENNYLIVPKLFGADGFWKTFDWNQASELGMKEIDLAYSGSYGFVETEMYWPINHMVAPKEDALSCTNCHGKKGNRMNWEALGYPGDPMRKGGRVKNKLVE